MQESTRGIAINSIVQPQKDTINETAKETGLEDLCADFHKRLTKFLETETPTELLKQVQRQTRISLGVIEEALTRYDLDQLAFSYNGGKDCLVLLILFLVGLHIHYNRRFTSTSSSTTPIIINSTEPLIEPVSTSTTPFPRTLKAVYILPAQPFAAVDDFVLSSSKTYHLAVSCSNLPMKAAFADYLAQNPHVKSIFVGTRRTDPHGANLTFFDETDHGWPEFMRCQPVIDWHYNEIWAFLRHLEIPYCDLYDLGYTSLGGMTDTSPNPALRIAGTGTESDGTVAQVRYRPAYELMDDEEERLGRNR